METIEQNKIGQKSTIPEEFILWGPEQAAEYLGYNRQYFMQYISKKPDFPDMRKSSTRKYPRWLKVDILQWASKKG